MTSSEDHESCDFRLFNLNKTGSTYDDKKITSISWSATAIFFRFGFYRYVKFNAYSSISEYLKTRQRAEKWYKIDIIINWEKNKTALYINDDYQTTNAFYHGADIFYETTDSDP